ncbi:MAG: AbrB/MazE/SpoVT family DNA-binding domain-containing protein [Candidatus Rokuibacteriota bacterium]
MRVQIQKWGNSLALRIPKPFAEDVAVKEGTIVDLSVSKGKVIAVPVRGKRATLKQLLARVKKGNLHREVEFGRSVGRESW